MRYALLGILIATILIGFAILFTGLDIEVDQKSTTAQPGAPGLTAVQVFYNTSHEELQTQINDFTADKGECASAAALPCVFAVDYELSCIKDPNWSSLKCSHGATVWYRR
jgi:hypothetical protein